MQFASVMNFLSSQYFLRREYHTHHYCVYIIVELMVIVQYHYKEVASLVVHSVSVTDVRIPMVPGLRVCPTSKKGLKFMVSNQEVLTLGAWTKTEHFLFEAVIAHLKKRSVEVSLQVVLALYNSIGTRLIQLSPVPLSLSSKSELQVKSKIESPCQISRKVQTGDKVIIYHLNIFQI